MADADEQAGREPGATAGRTTPPTDGCCAGSRDGVELVLGARRGGSGSHLTGAEPAGVRRGPDRPGLHAAGAARSRVRQRCGGRGVAARPGGAGARVCLFTDQANPTSNDIYEALGYRARRRHGEPPRSVTGSIEWRDMTDTPTPPTPRLAETFAEAEDALLSRWPETRLEPSLDRIRAFTELLGDPQRAYPVDPPDRHQRQDLDRADDRHAAARARPAHRPLHQPAPRADDRADLRRRRAADRRGVRRAPSTTSRRTPTSSTPSQDAPAVVLRDGRRRWRTPPSPTRRSTSPWSRSGMGGTWDATNVADAAVAVVLPIAVDHAHVPRRRRPPRSRSRRPGSSSPARSRCSPSRRPRWPTVLLRAGRRGRRHRWSARASSSASSPGCRRSAARWCRCRGCGRATTTSSCRCTARTRRRTPPSRWPRSRRSSATEPLDDELVRGGVRRGHLARAGSRSSGAARRSCSTPPTTRTAPRPRPRRSRTPSRSSPLIGVIGVMADKDHEGVLAAFEPHLAHVVCTQNSTAARDAGRRARPRRRARSSARTGSASRRGWPTRSTRPPALAEAGEAFGVVDRLGRGARHRLGGHRRRGPRACCGGRRVSEPDARRAAERSPRRGMCAAVLSLEAITLGLTTPVLITDRRRRRRHRAAGSGSGSRVACLLLAGMLRGEWAYALGWVIQVAAIGARASWSR